MASIFKSLSPTDYSIVPFPAYYKYSYTYESGSVNNSPDITFGYGEKYLTESAEVRIPNNIYELFDSVMQTFYSPIPYAAYGTVKKSYIPQYSTYVLSIGQDLYGEKVLPGSFSVSVLNSKIIDDTKGNLIVSSSGTGSIVGRIFYDKGVALIKPKDRPNLNPDPIWANGTSNDGTGWEFLLDRVHTSLLDETYGVTEPYPGPPTIAAKIGTRYATYWSGGSFFKQTVTPGNVYSISGWVYAGATTFRAILNNRAPGTDYQMGYMLTYLDSSDTVIGYERLTTELGAIGWNYLSKRVKINNQSIAKIMIGPFIDGPYPSGFSYGDPVCTDEQTRQGCPGYAWFAGFKIENLAAVPAMSGLDTTGLYITGGMSLTTQFTSSVTLYENAFKLKLSATDFLYAMNNPTAKTEVSGSIETPIQLMVSNSLKPYVTTLGLYNENNELLIVAKPSVPIQRTSDTDQTFIVKFDI